MRYKRQHNNALMARDEVSDPKDPTTKWARS